LRSFLWLSERIMLDFSALEYQDFVHNRREVRVSIHQGSQENASNANPCVGGYLTS
jgi:hypothetical protein